MIDRQRTGGWVAVAVFLGIVCITMLVLVVILKKVGPAQQTLGACVVMLMYVALGAFMILAARLFVAPPPESHR
jgi:bacteriorhodopsin